MPVLFRVFRSTGIQATNLFSGPKRNKALVRMIGTFFLSFRTFDFLMPFNVRLTAWPSERLRFISGEGRRFDEKLGILIGQDGIMIIIWNRRHSYFSKHLFFQVGYKINI